MRELVLNSGGMAAVPTLNTMGDLIPYCSASWMNYLTASGCWNYSYGAWGQMAALPSIPASVIAAPAAPDSALVAPYVVTPDQAQAASDAAMAQTQQNVGQWVDANVSDNPVPAVPCTWLNIPCTTLAIAGAAVFGLILLVRR